MKDVDEVQWLVACCAVLDGTRRSISPQVVYQISPGIVWLLGVM